MMLMVLDETMNNVVPWYSGASQAEPVVRRGGWPPKKAELSPPQLGRLPSPTQHLPRTLALPRPTLSIPAMDGASEPGAGPSRGLWGRRAAHGPLPKPRRWQNSPFVFNPQLLKFPPSPGGQAYPSQEPVYETVPGSFVPSSALHTMDPPLIPSSPGPSPGPTSYESLVPASPGQSYYSSLPAEGGFASFQGSHQGFVGDAGSQGYHSARSQGPQAYPGGGGSLGFLAAGGGSDLAVGMDPLLATSRCEPAAWSH